MSDGIDASRFAAHTFSAQPPQQSGPAAGGSAADALGADSLTAGSPAPAAPSTIPSYADSPAAAQTQSVNGRSFDEVSRQLYKQVQAAYQAHAANSHVAGHGQAHEPQPDEASTVASNTLGGNPAFDSSNGHIGDASVHAVPQPGILDNQAVDNPVAVDNENGRRVQREDEQNERRSNDDDISDEFDEDEYDDDNDEPETFAHLLRPMNTDRTN